MSEDVLETLRLGDSFLPVGSFATSYGLEGFVAADDVEDAADLAGVLASTLRHQVGPADCVAVRAANAAVDAEADPTSADLDAVATADRRLEAVTLPAEFRESAAHAGSRLLDLQQRVRDEAVFADYEERVESGSAPGQYAPVVGLATGVAGVDEREACLAYCHAFVTGLVGAAQRLCSLGHTDAQRVVVELRPAIDDAVEASADRPISEMTPVGPMSEVASAEHERADRRLFLS